MKIKKEILSLVEFLCFLFTIIATYKNWDNYRFVILMFFVSLFIMLPGYSHSSKIEGKFFLYIGKLSVPIFIFHWYIGNLINSIVKSDIVKIILFYGISIILSMIAVYLVDNWKWFQNIISKQIELKE